MPVRPNEAVPVEAACGTAVQCLNGTLWLTQEGQWRDFILIAGTTFVSAGDGKIVLSAPQATSMARIFKKQCSSGLAGAGRLYIDPGAVERLEREARRARLEEIGVLLRRIGGWIASAWRARTGHHRPEKKSPGKRHAVLQ